MVLEVARERLPLVPNCAREWFACGAPARAELKTSSSSQRRLHVRYSEQVFVITRCRRLQEGGDDGNAGVVSRLSGSDAERLTREDLARRSVEPPRVSCGRSRGPLTVEDILEAKRHVYELAVFGEAVEDPRQGRSLLVYKGEGGSRRKQQYQRSQLLAIPTPIPTEDSRRGFRNAPDLRNSVAR